MNYQIFFSILFSLAAILAYPAPAISGQLVYQPVNPGFGGYPNNFNYLKGLADAQNQFKSGGSGGSIPAIKFPDFNIDLGGSTGSTTSTTGSTTSSSGSSGSTSGSSTSSTTSGTQVSN